YSPDGTRVAFAADTGPGATDDNLWEVGADGSGLTQLTSTPDLDEFNPSWSPNGRRLLFQGCTQSGSTSQQCQLYVMASHGGATQNVSVPSSFDDSFSDGRTDPFWFNGVAGTGVHSAEVNGRLEQAIDADATGSGDFHLMQAAYFGQCRLAGDFDMRVHYALLE